MCHQDNIAVFDLDGTLWKGNSHYEILNAYFKTSFYTSLIFRFARHFFRKQMYKFICRKYEEIPKMFSLSFEMEFNKTVISILEQKKKEGYFCLIVSNAPLEIIIHASQRLGLPYLKAPIGKKKEVLDQNYTYKTLFVCTDNIEDIDLIEASDARNIVYTNANKKFFARKGF